MFDEYEKIPRFFMDTPPFWGARVRTEAVRKADAGDDRAQNADDALCRSGLHLSKRKRGESADLQLGHPDLFDANKQKHLPKSQMHERARFPKTLFGDALSSRNAGGDLFEAAHLWR